jgi:Trypsin-like peptidase domain
LRNRGKLEVRLWSVAAFVLGAMSSSVQAECVDPSTLMRSTVSITRYFDEGEQKTGSLGIRGTAWFLSPTSLVTVEHVTAAMRLSDQDWKQAEILEGENRQSIAVRIHRTAGSGGERISVLELRSAYTGARALPIRMELVAAEERVVSLAYPGNRLRFAAGRFVRYGDSDRVAGTALLEMYDGDDRLVRDHGASGAPILDCEGRVIAVVSNVFTQTMQSPFRAIRISTAWGQPNVVSVPVQVLSMTSETGSVRR